MPQDIFDSIAPSQPTPTDSKQDIFADVSRKRRSSARAGSADIFDSLSGQQSGPSLSDRAAQLGYSPLASLFAPKHFDTTQLPLDPFSNRHVTGPPMATDEEKQSAGTIGPREVGLGERLASAL